MSPRIGLNRFDELRCEDLKAFLIFRIAAFVQVERIDAAGERCDVGLGALDLCFFKVTGCRIGDDARHQTDDYNHDHDFDQRESFSVIEWHCRPPESVTPWQGR
jgi:hypothetical protein